MSGFRFKYVFFAGLVVEEVVRFPHRQRQKRDWRARRMAETRTRPLDFALDLLAFTGMEIIPAVYAFTSRLSFADYSSPTRVRWAGVPVLVAAIWLLRRAHADLGRSWSPTLQIAAEQALVTDGIYARIRHPMYAAVWLTGIAQALMLPNWIAGPACLALFLPVYLVRVPREERMMLDHFGPDYREYMERTGSIIPRLRR